jgi:hypothetical protein
MKIEIREIDVAEVERFSKPLADFNPKSCFDCGNKEGIVQRFFSLNVSASEENHNQIKKALIDKFGLTYYAFNENNDKIITIAKCPECDSEKMNWDY